MQFKTLGEIIKGPALLIAGCLLIRRLPAGDDWVVPLANWAFAVVALGVLHVVFKATAASWSLVLGASLALLLEGGFLYYDARVRPGLSIEWPVRISSARDLIAPSHEALIGGSLRNFNPATTTLKVYVCVRTEDSSACFLDRHSETPVISDGYWHAAVRFGNERRENEHGQAQFSVIVAAVEDGAPLPDPIPNNAGQLLAQLRSISRVVAGPRPVTKTYSTDPIPQFTLIESAGTNVQTTTVPFLRPVNYAVCPPVVVRWLTPASEEVEAAVEVYADGNPFTGGRALPRKDAASRYELDSWPDKIERIEVKISSAVRKGPYDSIWLKHGGCEHAR